MPDHKTLAGALAAFQAELPKLIKDEKAKVKGETKDGRAYDRSYGYADLAQVVETVLPVLGKNGLSITAATTLDEGQMVLVVTLLHESGELRTAYWPLPDPRRSGPQDIGSAMTYGRRYLTLALSGAYPGGEDDDGAKAQVSARERWEDSQPVRRPVEDRQAQAAPTPAVYTDEQIAEYHTKISKSDVTLAVKGYDWMASQGLHNRKIEMPTDDGPVQISATETLAFRLADLAVQPDVDLRALAIIRANAEDRGLLGVMVSDSTTLREELDMAKDVINEKATPTSDEPVGDAKADA